MLCVETISSFNTATVLFKLKLTSLFKGSEWHFAALFSLVLRSVERRRKPRHPGINYSAWIPTNTNPRRCFQGIDRFRRDFSSPSAMWVVDRSGCCGGSGFSVAAAAALLAAAAFHNRRWRCSSAACKSRLISRHH